MHSIPAPGGRAGCFPSTSSHTHPPRGFSRAQSRAPPPPRPGMLTVPTAHPMQPPELRTATAPCRCGRTPSTDPALGAVALHQPQHPARLSAGLGECTRLALSTFGVSSNIHPPQSNSLLLKLSGGSVVISAPLCTSVRHCSILSTKHPPAEHPSSKQIMPRLTSLCP